MTSPKNEKILTDEQSRWIETDPVKFLGELILRVNRMDELITSANDAVTQMCWLLLPLTNPHEIKQVKEYSEKLKEYKNQYKNGKS